MADVGAAVPAAVLFAPGLFALVYLVGDFVMKAGQFFPPVKSFSLTLLPTVAQSLFAGLGDWYTRGDWRPRSAARGQGLVGGLVHGGAESLAAVLVDKDVFDSLGPRDVVLLAVGTGGRREGGQGG